MKSEIAEAFSVLESTNTNSLRVIFTIDSLQTDGLSNKNLIPSTKFFTTKHGTSNQLMTYWGVDDLEVELARFVDLRAKIDDLATNVGARLYSFQSQILGIT